MATLVLFFDGVGVGLDDPASNPFAAAGVRRLAPLAGRAPDPACAFRALDATLDVPGLPQSATGQATLLTGVNAARLAGRHVPGLPGPSLRPLIERESLFLKLVGAGRRPTFANAYTRAHLEARRPRWSATTRMVRASGIPFRMLETDGAAGRALYHDYTGRHDARAHLVLPRHDARSAARVLAGLLEENDLVLYEYFLTDVAGHRGTWADRVEQAHRAEELTAAAVEEAAGGHQVMAVSDHGNLEEGLHRRHTRNPVPLLAWGPGSSELARRVRRLEDLTPVLVSGEVSAPRHRGTTA